MFNIALAPFASAVAVAKGACGQASPCRPVSPQARQAQSHHAHHSPALAAVRCGAATAWVFITLVLFF
ncbi:protein sprouty 2-like X3 [Biomphalaria pfeifferi]|uniref:Protein sprouty 2-like X3 n=1 Tax=Biomphalaria pfeifferi TaxID=112525 RepID=A0AAD8FH19_BIOPF|nr:protein sprouty 2-like X3 [Biomphalaria pfeifferi]